MYIVLGSYKALMALHERSDFYIAASYIILAWIAPLLLATFRITAVLHIDKVNLIVTYNVLRVSNNFVFM